MNTRIFLTAAVAATALAANAGAQTAVVDRGVRATALAASPVAVKPDDASALAQQVNQLFTERCGRCHKADADEEVSPHFVGNLKVLIEKDYVDLKNPEESILYVQLLQGTIPKTSRVEKKAGHKAVPFTPDENALVLKWIQAGAPAAAAVPVVIAAAEDVKPSVPAPTPPSLSPQTAARKVVRETVVLAAALQDLLSQPPEDQRDVRYLSLAALHNNLAEISDADLKLASDGVTKLLNSLSTNPKALAFPPVGPEGVLRRIQLKDLGWSAELWDLITATYPYALDSGLLPALASPAHSPVPLVRADWFAAVASRPPFYDEILHLQKKVMQDDGERFQTALRQARLPENGPREPLVSLVTFFERNVTLAQAAADLGLEKTELDSKLEAGGASLFDEKIFLRGSGIPRESFAEPFARIAIRLGFGFVRATAHPIGIPPLPPPAPIAIELKTDKAAYRQGELMIVTVQTSEDAFIRLSYQDAEGKVKILLPNAAHDGRINGGEPAVFGDERSINPATGKAFRLRVGPPYGEETLTVKVRKTPFGVSGAKTQGAEVEIVDAVGKRTQHERLGEARVKVITSE